MVIVVGVPVALILALLLGGVGLGYQLIRNISPIIWAISMAGLALFGIFESGRQIRYGFSGGGGVWAMRSIVSLLVGLFVPYYSYSFMFLVTQSIDVACIAGPLAALIVMGIYYSFENITMNELGYENAEKKKGEWPVFLFSTGILLAVIAVTSIWGYSSWKNCLWV